ncbi:DUF2244 domain-containing protein [Roseococcus sp. SDR]|uniref:DUF2244 domain-containing protein n=1 Tax=Roseococcus sp. SDR TaxID=2835532 RepID=UPI001BD16284|nr:DUF2244 domain-containing protein [Roseococcus sp. SDR]MBS7791466.1 DUF2244 domain-containing protein [Roseococcus sp. SDR]MBV1846780.1 DUF2244 domain-containing protein [Roseococcus sp. SDR]
MPETPVIFEARSAPLNSMGEQGFRIVAGILLAGFTFTGTVFTILGAWPVLVFAGAETFIVIGMLALYRRHARRSAEIITLSSGELMIRRREGRRSEEARFDPFWARLSWEESRLFIGHRGTAMEIGRFLTLEEREDLARSLGESLRRYREPVFDNPQLR